MTLRAYLTGQTAVLGFALTAMGPAAGAAYAPVNEPGPPLAPPLTALRASVQCSPQVGHSDKEPVLLVPGTWMTFPL